MNAPENLTVWVAGDAHIGTDLRHGRASLAEALQQSEGLVPGYPAIDWDIMIDVGDLSGDWAPPGQQEADELRRQYSVLTTHHRSQIYNIAGNHDASGPGAEQQGWFRRNADPTGEFAEHSGVDPARRPFAIDGTWERYSFRVGNITFLCLSDRNDGERPVGRGEFGGNPGGSVTGETFDWWVDQVETHQDDIVVTAAHYVLKETTVGSGPWEGFRAPDRYGRRTPLYHGWFPDGAPMGAGYLYWVDGNPDAQAFERYLAQHPGTVDLWLGGHTHAPVGQRLNGRGHVERAWGTTFVNCAALTRHHATAGMEFFPPASRVFRFSAGRAGVELRCYLHTDDLAAGGWHDPELRHTALRHPYRPDGGAPEVRPAAHHHGPPRPGDGSGPER